MLKIHRVHARDRRQAAVHEAGHVVMAEWLGVESRAYIALTGSDDTMNDKTWVGRAFYYGKKSSARTERLTAVAGAVAERCWQSRDDDGFLYEDHWRDVNAMSESDWMGAGVEPGCPDQKFMKAVLHVHTQFDPATGPLWPALVMRARRLIVDSRPVIAPTLIAA